MTKVAGPAPKADSQVQHHYVDAVSQRTFQPFACLLVWSEYC